MFYKDIPLEEVVEYVITQKRESDFWDVKQKWHERIEDLVKDIICFANTIHDLDCYLIIGITDEMKVCGIKEDIRRKQSDILDTLSKLQFAGDNIPAIELKTVVMPSDYEEDKKVDVDVLIIKNSYSTPYYLKNIKDNYKRVMNEGCIYSRVGDKNTPNKGNASIHQIEMLWKKRFGLTKSLHEHILDSLSKKTEWGQYKDIWYNIYKPEYVLRLYLDKDIDSNEVEFYSYAQRNESTSFYRLDIKAYNTLLESYNIDCVDSGRLFVPEPALGWMGFQQDNSCDCYRFYVKDSNNYKILQFLYDDTKFDQVNAYRNHFKVVLLFDSDDEQKAFEKYIEDNSSEYSKRLAQCKKYDYIDTGSIPNNDIIKRRLRIGLVLNEMLSEYRLMKC